MKNHTLERLAILAKAKAAHARVVRMSDGRETLVRPDRVEGDMDAPADVIKAAREALRTDRSHAVAHGNDRYFIHVHNPPRRMIIVGAVHISQPLTTMAALAGFDVTVIDPRGAFATAERFPNVTLMDDWPDDAMVKLGLDARTAVVTLTHDPKIDDPALIAALRSPAFYIGALGSRKTHASRLDRLKEAGFDSRAMSRIHGPIGLNLGGRAPAEIACAILAQTILDLHQGGAA
jgi:xanthine dehydrogenase accessory factor